MKEDCPLRGNCLTKSIVYKASVTHGQRDTITKVYFGLAGGTFKERFRNHTKSFRNEKYQNETELSKHIWDLKKKGEHYNLKWEIMKKSNLAMRRSGICNLCLEEKLIITIHKENSLNRRSELISTCRHKRKKNKEPPDHEMHPLPQPRAPTKSN